MSDLQATVLATLYEDHGCIHHAGANTGPCRTCKRRAAKIAAALADVVEEHTELQRKISRGLLLAGHWQKSRAPRSRKHARKLYAVLSDVP